MYGPSRNEEEGVHFDETIEAGEDGVIVVPEWVSDK
jgi:hypothetical protein